MTLWLVGMMGSGKSTVGRLVAAAGATAFVDTDARVEQRLRRSVAELIAGGEETMFRAAEASLVSELEGFGGVVATGGGVVLDPRSRRVISSGTGVWLMASVEELNRRLGDGSGRPLVTKIHGKADVGSLLEQRRSLYAEVAVATVDTDGRSPQEVAKEVLTLWRR